MLQNVDKIFNNISDDSGSSTVIDLRKQKTSTIKYLRNPNVQIKPTINKSELSYEYNISSDLIGSVNGFSLLINLPKIKGKFYTSYSKLFAYNLIKNFQLYLDDNLLYEIDGLTILYKTLLLKNSNNILEAAGENPIYRKFKKSETSYGEIFDERFINVYIPTPFDIEEDNGFEKSLNKDVGKVRVKVFLKPFKDCLNYISDNGCFNKIDDEITSMNLIIDQFSNVGKIFNNVYTDIKKFSFSINEKHINFNVNNFSKIDWFYVKRINNPLYYPKQADTHNEWRDSFAKHLAKSLLRIGDENSQTKNELIVEDNHIFRNEINKKIDIRIDGVPKNKKLFFKNNLIKIKCKSDKSSINFSEQFNKIRGYFSSSRDKIIFTKIEHNFNDLDLSISLDIIKSELNDDGEDNRLEKYVQRKYIINDILIGSLDFLGNIEPINFIKIKLGDLLIHEDFNFSNRSTINNSKTFNKIYSLNFVPDLRIGHKYTIKSDESKDLSTISFEIDNKNKDIGISKTVDMLDNLEINIILESKKFYNVSTN